MELAGELRRFYADVSPRHLDEARITEIVRRFGERRDALDELLLRKYGKSLVRRASPAASLRERLARYYYVMCPSQCTEKKVAKVMDAFAGDAEAISAGLSRKYGFSLEEAMRSTSPLVAPGPAAAKACFTEAALNVFSDALDASLLMGVDGGRVPVKGTARDNLSACRDLLPGGHPDVLVKRERKAKAEGTHQDVARAKEARRRYVANAHSLKDAYLLPAEAEKLGGTGPFSLLKRCLHEGCRIGVMIRRVNSIRGSCKGVLKGFDRYMNLLLVKVVEEYTVPARGRRNAADGSSGCSVPRRRHLPQILIRGDSVVSVWRVTEGDSAATAPPSASA